MPMKSFIFSLLFLEAVIAGTVSVDIFRGRGHNGRISRGNALVAEKFAALSSDESTYVPESLLNGFYVYYANLTVGSDSQAVSPQLDTGSSDLWLMSSTNPYCAQTPSEVDDAEGQFNCSLFEFDPKTSTTYQNLSIPFDIEYLDTTGAFGWLSKDTVRLGDATVPNATFAVANVANSSEAVFGVGYPQNEATDFLYKNDTIGGEYPNFPIMLKRDGYIDSVSYSLYLNDIDAQTGQILFGGVDHAKYDGTLGLMPIANINRLNITTEFTIKFNGISVRTGDNVCSLADFVIPALLDSGTSYAILPPEIVNAMGEAMGYTFSSRPDAPYWEGSCSPSSFGFDSFVLDFLGKKLEVTPQSLLDYLQDDNGKYVLDDEGNHICILAVNIDTRPGNFILGDVFLRNWYVVYDLDTNQIAMAQSNFNQTGTENIEPILSTIPGASSVEHYHLGGYQLTASTYSIASSCRSEPTSSASSPRNSSVPALPTNTTTASRTNTSQSRNSPITTASSDKSSKGLSADHRAGAVVANATATGPVVVSYATEVVSSFVTTCPQPTTFATNGETYTVTDSTVLTITNCPCTLTHSIGERSAVPTSVSGSSAGLQSAFVHQSAKQNTNGEAGESAATTAVILSSYVTTCPSPTTVIANGKSYTVTDSTVLTITDCPCTLTAAQPANTESAVVPTSPGVDSATGAEASLTNTTPSFSGAFNIGNSLSNSVTPSAAELLPSTSGAGALGRTTSSVAPVLANGGSHLSRAHFSAILGGLIMLIA